MAAVVDIPRDDLPRKQSGLVPSRPGFAVRSGSIAMDSSYLALGEPLTAADFGLATIIAINFFNTGGYAFEWDYANSKIKAYYGDNANVANGPLLEVPNATNLAALTRVPFFATGTVTV